MYNDNKRQKCLTFIEGYKTRLKNEPELTFKTYCNTQGCDYHSILRWMCRQNIYVSDLKAEAEVGARQEISNVFVPIVPRSKASEHKLLNGIDITFSDGISLHLNECGVEELISLLTLYKHRHTAKEVICSL